MPPCHGQDSEADEGSNDDREAQPGERATLWASTYILLGLRFPPEAAAELLRGVRDMKESSTYQAILEEGRNEGSAAEARRLLLLQGTERFGDPDESTRLALERINSVELLERLSIRLLKVSSWEELLALP